VLLGSGQLLVLVKSTSMYAIKVAYNQGSEQAGTYEVCQNARAGRRAPLQPPHGCFTMIV
jgi:hypothetical protein